ncbi:MAG: adenylyltransferase/cytidyltransferase family protein [Candidatus Levybacteria bacterium]|nr:adenylyltransferase/cytidyltransferase family protein [Candidatus Levybacteria bacterium]
MNKILSTKQAINLAQKLRKQNKSIVLAGGCFDVLHIGHITFLKNAKKYGDFLFVLLESDEKIKEIKGKNRPINGQSDRAEILSSFYFVDYVILLPLFKTNIEYDNLIKTIKPAIIATTKGDKLKFHKKRQAKLVNAKVVEVIKNISNKSTTKLIKILSEDI